MREISSAHNISSDEYLRRAPEMVRRIAEKIRAEKETGTRPKPSTSLLDRSEVLSPKARTELLDRVASMVDENLFGRAEMCMQFAELLTRALKYQGLPARYILGTAMYFSDGNEIFRWKHAWVRVGAEVIDGNVDILVENPSVPAEVRVAPYWGPVSRIPADRRLRSDVGTTLPPDSDVENVWWPELLLWLQRS